MRVLHTSDWHLGHTLRGEVTRELEHQAFLAWLVATCEREHPDALLITGDVFDSATPPASAERMWFEFLAAARRACPAMDIIAIAGNHDSPARLGAASSVLRELGVHVIGGLPRTAHGAIDLDRVLIPIAGGRGLVAAVPFLRPIDLDASAADPLEAVYTEVVAGLRARRAPTQAFRSPVCSGRSPAVPRRSSTSLRCTTSRTRSSGRGCFSAWRGCSQRRARC